jgi:hypothetical protein
MPLNNLHTEARAPAMSRRPVVFGMGLALTLMLAAGTVRAAGDTTSPGQQPPLAHFDEELQAINQELLELDRDLRIAEEDLLFPADTRVTVFLSIDTGSGFTLGAVQLKLDNVLVASEIYGPAERRALQGGGAQRLYVGSLRSGTHPLTLFFTGTGSDGQEYRRGTTVKIDKARGARILEFQIRDPERKQQPVAQLKSWQ